MLLFNKLDNGDIERVECDENQASETLLISERFLLSVSQTLLEHPRLRNV